MEYEIVTNLVSAFIFPPALCRAVIILVTDLASFGDVRSAFLVNLPIVCMAFLKAPYRQIRQWGDQR